MLKTTGLFVSHKLEELFEVSTRFTVLRDGKYIGSYDRKSWTMIG